MSRNKNKSYARDLKMTVNSLINEVKVNTDILKRQNLSSRISSTHVQRRKLYDVFGYDDKPKSTDYLARYLRQDIALRIIDAYPSACWRGTPIVTDDEGAEQKTEFETAWEDLNNRLKVFHKLMRLDKLSNLGEYAVLLIGFNDGRPMNEPLGHVVGIQDILHLTPFGDINTDIESYVTDPMDSRFGLPEMYRIEMGGMKGSRSSMPSKSHLVHHSRILHIAEGTLENEIFGIPRLQPILNRLVDLEKVVGGAAEIFWLNGRGGLAFNADKEYALSKDMKTALKKEIEEYTHQLQRSMQLQGVDVKQLDMSVANPEHHVSVILDLIAGATGIPKRILIGSERGELSSAQDENNWINRVEERQENFCDPVVLRPLVEKYIEVGILPTPKNGEFSIVWPELASMSEKDKAEIALKKAQSISQYANSVGSDTIIPPQQFVEDVLSMEYKEDEIDKILDEQVEELEEIEGGDYISDVGTAASHTQVSGAAQNH